MGGQGKTQTALRYCRKAFQNRSFNTVLWIDASSEISAHQTITSILSKAEIPTSALEFERNLLAFKDALTSLKGPCLLVFDNYDTPRNFLKIVDMFILHEQICIILTSRHHESLRLGTPIHVRDMDQSDAEDLLLTSSGLIRQDVDPNCLANTVNMLGCLPLALDQAGAYIRKLHLPLDSFEKHYIDKQKKILQYIPDLFEYRKSLLPGSEPSVLSVFTTWELSLEQLGDERPHLEHLLTLSAFFDHNKIHEALFSTRYTLNFTACSGVQDSWLHRMHADSAWDSYRFQDIIANLYSLSLLQQFWIEDGHIIFSLHPLVNDWLRTRIGEKDRASMIVEAAVTVAGMDGSLNLFPHLQKCWQGLCNCAQTLIHDCVDMDPRRRVANGAPEAKLVADEVNLKPHSCCPHGRPCQTIPSTVKLESIVARSMACVMSSEIQKQPSMSMSGFSNLTVSIQTPDPLSPDIGTMFHKFRREFEKYNDQYSEEDQLFLKIETLNQEAVTLSQKFEESFQRGVDGRFHTKLQFSSEPVSRLRAAVSIELADLAGLLEQLIIALNWTDDLVAIRNDLRSLPFLQSGF